MANKKVLVLNGSPKKEKSATMVVTNAFLKGLNKDNNLDIKIINVSDLNIKPCLGCLSCWGHTEGECIIKNDDVTKIKEEILASDIIIESYGLFFFGMPGQMKVLTDRLLSVMKTYRGQEAPKNNESYHGIRYDMTNKKFILISSCAYTDLDLAYDPLLRQYDCICGKKSYTAILSTQLKTLIDIHNDARLNRYLNKIEKAGESFITNGYLTCEELESIKKPPFTKETYKVLLNNFWTEEKER